MAARPSPAPSKNAPPAKGGKDAGKDKGKKPAPPPAPEPEPAPKPKPAVPQKPFFVRYDQVLSKAAAAFFGTTILGLVAGTGIGLYRVSFPGQASVGELLVDVESAALRLREYPEMVNAYLSADEARRRIAADTELSDEDRRSALRTILDDARAAYAAKIEEARANQAERARLRYRKLSHEVYGDRFTKKEDSHATVPVEYR